MASIVATWIHQLQYGAADSLSRGGACCMGVDVELKQNSTMLSRDSDSTVSVHVTPAASRGATPPQGQRGVSHRGLLAARAACGAGV